MMKKNFMPTLFQLLLILTLAVAGRGFAAHRPPNIIYIMADDLGYGHLGCYGQKKIRTPNIDHMAAEGMKFTQAYAGSHVCAPARSTLMTGLHTGHTPIRANGKNRFYYDADVTVAEVLKKAGYATGGFGKWGGGLEDGPGAPWKQGFDEWFGQLSQMHAHFYYPYWLWKDGKKYYLPRNENNGRGQYSQDEIHEQAKDFIRRHADEPFFAYLPYVIPHVELVVPEDSEAEYRGKFPVKEIQDPRKGYIGSTNAYATYAGMITRLDKQVGEIFSLLKELHLDYNTLVIFTSDNGAQGATWQPLIDFFQGNGVLRGAKGDFYEGGIRVPFIARWPGMIRPGTTSDLPIAFWDMMPTLAEIGGADAPSYTDGISFAPTLLGKGKQVKHEFLYWEYPYGNNRMTQAIRMGDWKLMQPKPGKPFELYNLANDISEQKNLAKERPDMVEKLKLRLSFEHVEERDYPDLETKPVVADFVE